jgi:hypothetical protein
MVRGLWQPWPPLANLIREMTLPGPPTKLRGFLLGSYFLCRCADVLTNKKNGHAVMVTSTAHLQGLSQFPETLGLSGTR